MAWLDYTRISPALRFSSHWWRDDFFFLNWVYVRPPHPSSLFSFCLCRLSRWLFKNEEPLHDHFAHSTELLLKSARRGCNRQQKGKTFAWIQHSSTTTPPDDARTGSQDFAHLLWSFCRRAKPPVHRAVFIKENTNGKLSANISRTLTSQGHFTSPGPVLSCALRFYNRMKKVQTLTRRRRLEGRCSGSCWSQSSGDRRLLKEMEAIGRLT